MNQSMLNKQMDYTFSQYYHNCDIINKYNLSSFEKRPYIKQISFELSLNKVIDSLVHKSLNINTNNVQTLSFLFFYIISTVIPFISFKQLKLTLENVYSLKIVFNNQQEIYKFLHDITLFLKLENIPDFIFIKNKNSFTLKQFCKGESFIELENIINKYFKNINIKELKFFLRLNFVNILSLKSSKKFIHNFPFLFR